VRTLNGTSNHCLCIYKLAKKQLAVVLMTQRSCHLICKIWGLNFCRRLFCESFRT